MASRSNAQMLREARDRQRRFENQDAPSLKRSRAQIRADAKKRGTQMAAEKKTGKGGRMRPSRQAAAAAAATTLTNADVPQDEQNPAAGVTGQVVDRPTQALRKSQNVQAPQEPSNPYNDTFVNRLARFREQNFATQPKVTPDRGFQYQPSQWAQDVARRNALKRATQTVSTDRGWERVFDPKLFDAQVATDPRLQGLARSEQFQNNVTQDAKLAVDQRAQDNRYQLGTNDSNNRLRASMADVNARMRGQNMEMLANQQKLRQDQLRQQGDDARANREEYRTIADRYARQVVDGKESINPRRSNEIAGFLAQSPQLAGDPAAAEYAANVYAKFADRLEEAGGSAFSSTPILNKIFGFNDYNFGKAVNVAQLQEQIDLLQTNEQYRSEVFGGNSKMSQMFLDALKDGGLTGGQ